MGTKRPPLDELLSLFGATIAAQGITTGAGAAAGNSFKDAGLAGVGANSFISMLAILYPGQPRLVDSKDITGFNNTNGEVTLDSPYKGVAAAIPAGVPYKIVTFRFVPAEVAAIEAKLDHATYGLAALKTLLTTIAGYLDTEIAAILEDTGTTLPATLALIAGYIDTEVASILAYVDCLPAALGNLVTKNLADILSDSVAFDGANIALIKTQTDKIGDATIGLAALKAYVDLIDDATNGLAAIKAEVEGLAGAAMRGTDSAALAASWTAALATALGNYTAARAGYLDNINQAGLLQLTAARAALLDQITALRMAELDAANIPADTDPKVMGRTQIFEKSITSAANAGDVVVATITTQPCQIESVVIHADAAQTADMTSCGVFGGAGKVVTFISAADAIKANLDAADKQVAWAGAVRLAATKTIVISLVGTGATAVDLTIVVKYRASVSGGYLA